MNSDNDKLLLSRAEASRFLSISTSSIDVLVRRGMVETCRIGRRRLIPRTELEAVAKKSLNRIWPPKVEGKTTRSGKADAAPGVKKMRPPIPARANHPALKKTA